MKAFGERLRELRVERKMTQQQLGDRINVSRGAIFGWEKDLQEPNLETLVLLAKFFEVSVDYLLGIENVMM